MANTTNFNWATPDDTDLVKDGAAAIRTLGSSIDSSLVDLKGGTTGQILSKASNTDLDYTWIANDQGDITEVQAGTGISVASGTGPIPIVTNTVATEFDAKGDLVVGTGADTFDRLAAGANGETLVADSSASTGLRWQGNFAAAKNAVINGDFRINQRSFTSTTTSTTYGFDRWFFQGVDGTTTYSAQTFTPGTAPVSGYEGINFARIASTGQTLSSAQSNLRQHIEDARTFAGRTVTVSFWAKAASGTPSVAIELSQYFGTGGSPSSTVNYNLGKVTLSTSWQRFSSTIALNSLSGVTFGTNNNSSLLLILWTSAGSNFDSRTGTLGIQTATIDFWGVQVEAANTATAFQTATGTLAGELQAAQRYYYRITAGAAGRGLAATGWAYSTTAVSIYNAAKSTMRTSPTSVDFANLGLYDGVNAIANATTAAIYTDGTNENNYGLLITGATGLTQYRSYQLVSQTGTTGYIGLSAEL